MPFLIGPLAHAGLRGLLVPEARPAPPLSGRLLGGAGAGVLRDGFPMLAPGSEALPLWQADWTDELRRYAEIFDLHPVMIDGCEILGLALAATASAQPWQPDLAIAMARHLLTLPQHPAQIRQRLPQIATWISARLRAARDTAGLPGLGPEGAARWRPIARTEPYAGYFSVEEITLRHRRYRGGWTPDVLRAVFVSGDATVVLPWDPQRDRVLLIDQFRAAPAARDDRQPWIYETVAGRVDADETPEQAARREAREEAGLTISRLIPGPHHYPSPGAVAEFLYLYVGIADLPDGTAGLGGLDSEDEDIRSHVIAREELTRMALSGQIRNGPLLSLALWLELSQEKIRMELALERNGLIP
ncbi:MAG: NUDIX domain-containing protein [Paracoccus sp. (in: a-proteobacteria)]|uniref:NUDIX domain-containing protein n=1 Tax=Paracoccus sp. TaxID=267 RepID=UPI0039E5E43C